MAVSLLLDFSALLFVVGSARAQVSAPNCSDPRVAPWSFNTLGQGPCLVAAYLASMCNNGAFTIAALLPQHSYTGPNGPDNGDLCKCNTVTYNLISACDACQEQPWIPYSAWTTNCTAVATPRTFPETIPEGTRVPRWAYLDPTSDDSWNITMAQLAADSPEATGGVTIVPASSRSGQSSVIPRTISPVSSSSSKPSFTDGSDVGELAGGVVGGIVGAVLIAGIVLWSFIHKRRIRSAPSAKHYIDVQDDMGQVAVPHRPHPLTIETPKLYDPEDPSTYPTQTPSRLMQLTNYSSQSELQYSGLPEV